MKYLLFAVLCLFPTLSFAQIDTSGLTKEQQARLVLQAEEMKNKKPLMEASEVKEWVGVGHAVADALGGAAEKLNVEIENFANSTAGRITIAVVIWKFIGKELVFLITSILLISIGSYVWWSWFKKLGLVAKEEFNEKGKLVKRTYLSAYYGGNMPDHVHGWRVAMFIVLAGLVISSNVIFWNAF